MKPLSIPLALAVGLILSSAILGFVLGQAMTPEYRSHMWVQKNMDLGPADVLVDLRYVNAMIGHHEAAILLAQQLRTHSSRESMQELATTILADEPRAIAELYAWKRSWYKDARIVSKPQVPNLGSAGKNFDLRFINAMIAHHEEGIQMTREIRIKSNRNEVLDNADTVEAFLRAGIVTLRDLRLQWYGVQ